jgi:formate-dependent nitrite reductase cytochrome c552 subunit
MFSGSKHAGLELSCAKCHQNVGEHAKAQLAGDSTGPVPSLKRLKANDINTTCLSCHEKDNQSSYSSSMHARRNVACTACHSVHSAK